MSFSHIHSKTTTFHLSKTPIKKKKYLDNPMFFWMNVLNRVFCLFFLSWLCFFTPGSCKAFLKNCSFQSFNASFLEESPINKRNDRNSSNNNEIYYSLNELGTVSDHMSLSNRNLLPEVVTLAEISSEIDEAKVVTHHFVANVYLQVRSYLNTPSGVCIFVVLMLLGLLIVAKSL